MTKTKILSELLELTKIERQEIHSRSTELESKHPPDDDDPVTVHEEQLLEARLAAYAKDPDAGSTWKEGGGPNPSPASVVSRSNEPRLVVGREAAADINFRRLWHYRRRSIGQDKARGTSSWISSIHKRDV